MTLEQAIIHAEDVAEINQSIADNTEHDNWMDIAQCEKCAEEHRQLTEWLKELQKYRKIKYDIDLIVKSLKTDNSEYLKGYISALSAISEMMEGYEAVEHSHKGGIKPSVV